LGIELENMLIKLRRRLGRRSTVQQSETGDIGDLGGDVALETLEVDESLLQDSDLDRLHTSPPSLRKYRSL
jgi:hypothetical protein